ncbi:MAG: dUTP diphosphatase [Clostridium sp.]|uniref:dUTP diphosphatase n=1 Tax=Clostridium TaxID=1485 RepID=UPI0021525E9F|nr:dUTP diphosphatase [Clostridium sp. LY3-2]MCR6516183.1 dUTP diphosphatase [Clostridium sp. LY3-2]
MFICDLFKIQEDMDKKLSIDGSLDDYKLRARKNLELHVKVSELANVTRCYNYLNDNNLTIDTDAVFDKYLDCIHQVISVGITNGYTSIDDIAVQPTEYCLSDQFLNLYIDINDLIISRSRDHFETLLEDLLSLGNTLGFSKDKILNNFCR